MRTATEPRTAALAKTSPPRLAPAGGGVYLAGCALAYRSQPHSRPGPARNRAVRIDDTWGARLEGTMATLDTLAPVPTPKLADAITAA